MGIEAWFTIALGVIITIVGFVFTSNINDIKGSIKDLKDMIQAREDRNFDEHEKIYGSISVLEKKTVEIETVQNHCGTCQNRG